MKNGKLVATLGAVALVAAIGVGSTFAYLTSSTGPVENKFEMGNVTFEDDPDLLGGLVEHKVDEQTGKKLTGDAEAWVTTNTYKKLTPGQVVDKDPTVFVDDKSEDAWLFVRITKNANFEDLKIDTEGDKFVVVKTTDKYIYAMLDEKAVAGEDYVIFTSAKVKADLVNGTELGNIDINAALIQAAGFEKTDKKLIDGAVRMLDGGEF